MLFKKKRDNEELNQSNKNKMKELLDNLLNETNNYQLIYGYNILESLEHTYVYQSLVIGFDVEDKSLVIVPTDKEFTESSNIIYLKKNDIKKIMFNNRSKMCTVFKKENKRKQAIKFFVVVKNLNDLDFLPYIIQKEEVKNFVKFLKVISKKEKIKKTPENVNS